MSKRELELYQLLLSRANNRDRSLRNTLAISFSKDRLSNVELNESIRSMLMTLYYYGVDIDPSYFSDSSIHYMVSVIEDYSTCSTTSAVALIDYIERETGLISESGVLEGDEENMNTYKKMLL